MQPFPRNQFREFAHPQSIPIPGCHSHSSLNSSFNEAKLSESKGRVENKGGRRKERRRGRGEGGDVTRGCPVGLGRATRPPPRPRNGQLLLVRHRHPPAPPPLAVVPKKARLAERTPGIVALFG